MLRVKLDYANTSGARFEGEVFDLGNPVCEHLPPEIRQAFDCAKCNLHEVKSLKVVFSSGDEIEIEEVE